MSPIIEHPDVQRMLMTMKAYVHAARGICHLTAAALDLANHGRTEEERTAGAERAALLTPIAKAFSTDIGDEAASLGVQIHGGMGFIEETGAAQHMRDSRIAAIYEGANGIQAIDLVAAQAAAGRRRDGPQRDRRDPRCRAGGGRARRRRPSARPRAPVRGGRRRSTRRPAPCSSGCRTTPNRRLPAPPPICGCSA